MDASLDEIFPQVRKAYVRAVSEDFPAFLDSIDLSTPLNASPYLVGLTEFVTRQRDPGRDQLVARLQDALNNLRDMGANPQALLIGGSFLDSTQTPHDLDCVVYYESETRPSGLARWQLKQHDRGLDLRLVPIDSDPILVLKMTLFFGALYGRGRGALPALRGTLLVDCGR